ncbi:MAG: formate dehydrogenase accessory sulfurtransferase FdhD [Syntrophobacterales bacterium]|jgi:FdhD protein|nr:formate dehydrogenase accessory sulfurtransferase FdhD [Syntrophobacterales bacterium]
MDTAKTLNVQRFTGVKFVPSESRVVVEKELPVYVNGEHLATASLVPSMEKEFVAGYLFGQGFIDSVGEIVELKITERGADVVLVRTDVASTRKTKASCRIVSGGGRTAYFESGISSRIKSGLKIERRKIFRAMNTLFENAVLYDETGGVHAAALFDEGMHRLSIVEDIGRHNTLDKIIGYALFHNIDFAGTFVVSTGRMSSEMIVKVCRAGIPLVATKTAVTDEGLRIAEDHGLTVVGFVRDAGSKMHTDMEVRVFEKAQMKIYTGADRVL